MEDNIQTLKKSPELNWRCVPAWWHHHGFKLDVSSLDKANNKLTLESTAVIVEISLHEKDRDIWAITWNIKYSLSEYSNGSAMFSRDNLKAAFLSRENVVSSGSEWLIDRYGGDAALQGRFIRWYTYLNIPCPGTGHDGDPNVSIELNHNIHVAIKDLLSEK